MPMLTEYTETKISNQYSYNFRLLQKNSTQNAPQPRRFMLKIQILERVVPLPQILSQRERLGIQNSSIMSYVYYIHEI